MTTPARVSDLLDTATEVVDEHLDRTHAARVLADHAGGDREALHATYLEHLQRAPRLRFDVFHATAVLGVIEEALTRTPRTPSTEQRRTGRESTRPSQRSEDHDG